MRNHHPLLGWLGIMGIVVGYDVWAIKHGRPTLSRYYDVGPHLSEEDRRRSRNWRRMNNTMWICLSWHLMHGDHYLLPQRARLVYRKVHPAWRWQDAVTMRVLTKQGETGILP